MKSSIIFEILIGFSFLIFFLPTKIRYAFTLLVTLALILVTGNWAVNSLFYNISQEYFLNIPFWTGNPKLTVDGLSAFFILTLNFTILTGLLYGRGYLEPYIHKKRKSEISLHYFSYIWLHIAMLLVCMLRDGIAFLVAWELMSVSSFLLVIFENEKKEVLKTGINYLIQMHIGMLFLLVAFILSETSDGIYGFDALVNYFQTHSNLFLFILFFIGFGIKAGFIPLHSWLPHAHPAAPSHISGVMSGVMIKMGIYGILRVALSLDHDLLQIGIFVLIISLISGILGVMLAIVQHDLKKLLAYHSIENIGIIGIGIGLGLIGKATGNAMLALLGFSGGILHVLNHSLFKSLLFYCAGSVYQQCHTKDINHFGGLIKKMPYTSLFFLLASLSICGLPPFNGFISEFLIYSGMFQSISGSDFYFSILFIGSIIGLTLIGGLAMFCFTKAFGISFLGVERTEKTNHAKEVANDMLLPKFLIAALILSIGIIPVFFIQPIMKVASLYYSFPPETQINYFESTMINVGFAGGIFLIVISAILGLRKYQQKKVAVAYGPTWGCGNTAGTPQHQYTATTFADNYVQLAKPILNIHTHYPPLEKEDIFPQNRKYETHSSDLIEQNILLKPIDKFLQILNKATILQTGKVQHYIVYPLVFIILVIVLTFLKLI